MQDWWPHILHAEHDEQEEGYCLPDNSGIHIHVRTSAIGPAAC
jgi:hypothetical protein